MSGITEKGKIGQFFCKHSTTGWFKKKNELGLSSISGETHYHICKDCGKTLGSLRLEYEGMGFK